MKYTRLENDIENKINEYKKIDINITEYDRIGEDEGSDIEDDYEYRINRLERLFKVLNNRTSCLEGNHRWSKEIIKDLNTNTIYQNCEICNRINKLDNLNYKNAKWIWRVKSRK